MMNNQTFFTSIPYNTTGKSNRALGDVNNLDEFPKNYIEKIKSIKFIHCVTQLL